MTDTDVDVEAQARRIADRGQDALVNRLRSAYADAAAAHADLISLDDEQIEAMVQAAAENGDGLQWRRALAGVAAEELGISATEALTHPAVARAQALVGAPSYEQSLAELIARPVPPAQPGRPSHAGPPSQPGSPSTAQPSPDAAADSGNGSVTVAPAPVGDGPEPPAAETPELPSTEEHQAPAGNPPDEHQSPADAEGAASSGDELETVEADDIMLELLPEPDPIEYETESYDVERSFPEEQEPPTFEPEPFSAGAATAAVPAAIDETEPYASAIAAPEAPVPASPEPQPGTEDSPEESDLVIAVIHLGGVANLPTKRDGLGVRLSADGLDILQGEHDIVGRLVWDEIEALEVPNLRVRRRRHEPRGRLVVRTPHGDASFDVPGVTGDDLRDRVEPFFRLYGGH